MPSPPRCRPTGRLSFPRGSSCRPNHRQREKVIRKPPRLFPPRCRPTSPYFLPMPPHAVAQLQQQRMQVLRCQEFEPSFFAESQGLEVQTDRPRSKLIHKQIDRQPSTAFARTIFKYWLPLHPAPHRRTPLAPWRAYPRRPLPRLCTHTHEGPECRVGGHGRENRPLSRSKVSMRSPDLAGGHGREKRPLQGVQILQEGTGERRDCSANGVPICKT